MSTIHAVYENGVFRPTVPVDLPERCEVAIIVTTSQPPGPAVSEKRTALQRLADVVKLYPPIEDLPSDSAAQLDHYLYGMPKKP